MELLTLLSKKDDVIIPEVRQTLKGFTIYPLKAIEEFEDLYNNIPVNLLLIDTDSYRLSQLGDLLQRLDNDMVILITPEKPAEFTLDNLPSSVYGCVNVQSIRTDLSFIVERALERQRFKNIVELLKQSKDNIPPQEAALYREQTPITPLREGARQPEHGVFPVKRSTYEMALVNLAKMLTVGFDKRRLFEHFMDSVAEIARVSKMSIMLKDKEEFHIKAHIGLNPSMVDNLRFRKDSALLTWLAKTGRIRYKPVNPTDTVEIYIKSEMELLQCTFSFPMIRKGKLIGIFNIDNKITGEPFYREELEIIYILCGHLTALVKDIDLYHQIWYQKEFTKNILSSMTSGVIVIGSDEKVTVFNQQASEILGSDPSSIVGHDLRGLPSPLGDILYETMVAGALYKRHEVIVGPARLPIGINSYRLLDENQTPIGAGIVFSDLSDSKRLGAEKRKTERLEAVNELMAKVAHEIRNPMTSIYTYAQLMNEKYRDDDLNNFYAGVVSQSIQRLDSLIDKLVIFSSKPEYNFQREDANLIISEVSELISERIPRSHKFLKHELEKTVFINADKKFLKKAIYYLILSIVDRTPEGGIITFSADEATVEDNPYLEISIKWDGRKFTDEERQNLLKSLFEIDNLGAELNIPISYKIVEEHGGNLSIISEGETNKFIIQLPIMERVKELRDLREEPINE